MRTEERDFRVQEVKGWVLWETHGHFTSCLRLCQLHLQTGVSTGPHCLVKQEWVVSRFRVGMRIAPVMRRQQSTTCNALPYDTSITLFKKYETPKPYEVKSPRASDPQWNESGVALHTVLFLFILVCSKVRIPHSHMIATRAPTQVKIKE